MPKGYWVAHIDVRDPAAYEEYRRANAAPLAAFGARFIVRGAPQTQMEGATRARTVVIEFPSLEAAQACYASPGYQAAKALRDPVSTGDLVILAGWDA